VGVAFIENYWHEMFLGNIRGSIEGEKRVRWMRCSANRKLWQLWRMRNLH